MSMQTLKGLVLHLGYLILDHLKKKPLKNDQIAEGDLKEQLLNLCHLQITYQHQVAAVYYIRIIHENVKLNFNKHVSTMAYCMSHLVMEKARINERIGA